MNGLAPLNRRVVTAVADPASLLGLPPAELDLLLRLIRRVRLLGRVAWDLRAQGLIERFPLAAQDQFESALVAAAARHRVGLWELDRIHWALDGLALTGPIVVLKGCAYALAGTPNARGRMFSDVDLLVAEADLPGVESRLKQRGWRAKELTPYDDHYYRAWAHELPPLTHGERQVELDLHHNLLMRTARLKPQADLLLQASRRVAGSSFRVLAPVDMVLNAIVHLFYGGEMDDALRELGDIDLLLRHFVATEPGFWEQFWPRTETLDLARPAFYGLRYAGRFLGTPVPTAVLRAAQAGAPSAVVVRVMDAIVERSLFPRPFEGRDPVGSLARGTAFLRSHWVKMPASMLVRHLSLKFGARFRPSDADA
jgi:hypothetical protein